MRSPISKHSERKPAWAGREEYRALRDLITLARPQCIERLAALNELPSLWRLEPQEFDEMCLAKLKEIALRENFHLMDLTNLRETLRKPTTLQEALYGGSQAAALLILLRMRAEEGERFKTLYRLEAQRRKAYVY